ncbi:MAG: MFS transporter [Sphingobacteriia bacterium]|nr:MFS transporter [Sphingobacteriia bacterium]
MFLNSKIKPYAIWLIPLFFFAYQFILRNSPALLIDDLMLHFKINASQFALFSSMFYVTYSLMQIPTGLLLDRFNPGIVLSSLILTYTFGAYLFSITDNFHLAVFARMLMGIGATAGFLGGAKVISLYFPKSKYSILISLTFTAGFLGAIYGGKPVSILMQEFGWHEIFAIFTTFGIVIALLSSIFIRKNIEEKNDIKFRDILKDIKEVFSNKNIVLVALFGGFMMGSTEGFADAWGVKYLVSNYGFDKHDASLAVSMIYLGLALGGPFLVLFAEKFSNYYITTFFSGIIMVICFGIFLLPIKLTFIAAFVICLFIGISSGSQVLIFSINDTLTNKNHAALTAALTNSIVMSFGLIIHQTIGFIIDFSFKNGESNNSNFSLEYFKIALSVIPVLMIIGSVGIIAMKRNKQN